MNTPLRNCSTCAHHTDPPGPKVDFVFCRRYPPTVTILLLPQGVGLDGRQQLAPAPLNAYPQLAPTEVCGEFAPNLKLFN